MPSSKEPHPKPTRPGRRPPTSRSGQLRRAISRWENEGGATPDPSNAASATNGQTSVLLTNAELVQLQVRVIALEHLVTALLACSPSGVGALVDELARCIQPRAGCTPHHLTIHAAAHMVHLAHRSDLLRGEAAESIPPCAKTG